MIDELRATIRAKFKPDFEFTTVEDVPFVRVSNTPQSIALITTAGLHLDDQPPFDRVTPSGDCSFRRIRPTERSRIRADHQFASQDLGCAFPLALLANPAPVHYSFSGAIPDPRPLLGDTGPRVARELRGVADAVVIAPS